MPDRHLEPQESEITRRVMLRGAAVGGMALPFLAACGEEPETTGGPRTETSSGTGNNGTGGAGGGGEALARTADVPVGGGQVLQDQQIVLTQPTDGEFKAFDAVCTHRQCLVNQVSDGKIICPCHGSQYSIEDGSVLDGPAPEPLAEVPITVEGGEILTA